jgi:RHS repeat-associated protein
MPLRVLPGQYFDSESGLHYNYFRDYDPKTGRYIQPDPIGLAGGMNLFSYAENNPVNLIDPTGEWAQIFIRIANSPIGQRIASSFERIVGRIAASPAYQRAGLYIENLIKRFGAKSAASEVTECALGNAANRLGTLTRVGENVWESSGGLRYAGLDREGLNRVLHVLDHTAPNYSKLTHSVFNVPRNEVLGLVDEAWVSAARVPILKDPGSFVTPMGRTVGTIGENAIKIIVRPGTNEVITSYPIIWP